MGNLSEIHVLRELPDTKKTIDEALNIEERNLYDIFEDEDFQVPDYQRNYSWEKTQREDLWTTLKNAFKELEPLPDDLSDLEELTGIYMGAMYFAEPSNNDDNKRLDVVDGQQRLATFQLLLKVSYDYVLYLKGRANDEELYGLADDLRKVEQKLNEAYNDESEPSVQLNEEDKDYFQALAADPDRWYIGLKSFLENRIERDDHVSGQMKPRAITIEEIISQIQSPIKYNGDRDVSSEFSGELGTWIRYEKSHERMMNTYTETYSLIEDILTS
ncbi:DUF262 domain-containing protein [Natrinema sp. SYSU A 869]|uniref:DUF262 domain-containing protein n=1 Tax=Natrinema sp. SYSU A 869 TaxID=2871694 RepID=UPI001CA3A2FF|nr:DUF262 domain-containing protein [Natrinema sp. SYSU A 869]